MKLRVTLEFDIPDVPHKTEEDMSFLREDIFDNVQNIAVLAHLEKVLLWLSDLRESPNKKLAVALHKDWSKRISEAKMEVKVI